jgi:hypothetical protein
MKIEEFYDLLDIESVDEFKYYENLANLLEADEHIDSDLIGPLVREVDRELLHELMYSFFDEFLEMIPDTFTDLFVTVETIKRSITGKIAAEMEESDIDDLTDAIMTFRKWYVTDKLVIDRNTADELSVRDAMYNMTASKYTVEDADYDFRAALEYDADTYSVDLAELLEIEQDDQS